MGESHITIELTHQCNNKCFYCYNEYREKCKKYNDINIVKKHIEDIINSQIDKPMVLVFSGGEPTLDNEYLFEILMYTYKLKKQKNLQFDININTNCTNLSDKLLNAIIYTKTALFISLISKDKLLYNKITNSDNYDKFIENLKKVINKNVRHSGNLVVNVFNYQSLEESCDYFFNIGVKTIVTSLAHGKVEGFFDKESYNKYIDQCLSLKKKYNDSFGFCSTLGSCQLDRFCLTGNASNGRQLVNCSFIKGMTGITPENIYVGCCRQPFELFVKADSYDESKIKNKKILALLPEIPNECKDCLLKSLCFGLCGHDIQLRNTRRNEILKIIDLIKNEDDFKHYCKYYNMHNEFIDEVRYVNENLYTIWDVINIFRKVLINEEYNNYTGC